MSRISKLNSISMIAACIVAYAPLMAQATTGTLAGTVKNTKGEIIAGAMVRITSPNLMQPRETRSDERGNWRFSLLPPGEYRVVFSKEGYVSASRQDIRVGLDTVIRADVSLRALGIAQETVEIVAETGGTIDKSDTKASTNFSAEQLDALGYSSLTGAASLAAGAVESEAGGFSVRGAAITDTLFRMDGVDIKNDYQGNVSGTRYLADMIEDIQVNLSPVHPRYGRTTGGSVNVVTKAGSNNFSATARAYLNKTSAWTATRRGLLATEFDEGGRYTDDWSTKRYDITLLGPIIKDKLWFSFGTSFVPGSVTNRIMTSWTDYPDINYGPMKFTTTATATAPATAAAINQKLLDGPDGYHYTTFDALKHFQQRSNNDFYQGKLTWTFLQNHTLEYSLSTQKSIITNRDPTTSATSGYVMMSMLGTQTEEHTNWGINYKGVIGPSTIVEARYGSSITDIHWPDYLHPTIQDPIMVTLGRIANQGGGPGQTGVNAFTARRAGVSNELRGSKGWAVNAKHYWYGFGQHESEVGVESYTGRLQRGSAYGPNNRYYTLTGVYLKDGITDVNDPRAEWMFGSGPYMGVSLNGQSSSGRTGPAAVWRQFFGKDGEQNPISTSLYAADQWNVNDYLSGMVGFRFEKYNINDTDGSKLASSTQFIPRASLKYDPTGTTKHLLTLSYALYASDFYTGFTNAFASNASSTYTDVGWTGKALGQIRQLVTANETVPLELLRFFTYQDLINPKNWEREDGNFNSFGFTSGDTYYVDKNMKPPVVHEVSFRYQRQFDNKSLFSIGLTQKKWRQLWAIWQEHDPRQWVRLTDPFGSDDIVYGQMIRYGNSDKLKRDYFGLEVDFNHIITKVWSVRTAIGYSTLKGNDEGGDSEGGGWNQPSDTFRDNSTTPMFYNRNLILGATPPPALGKDHWEESDFAPYGYLRSHQLLKGRLTLVGRFALHRGGHVTFSWVAEYDTSRANSPTASVNVGTLDREYPLPTIGTLPTWNNNFTRHYMARGAWSSNDSFRVVMNTSWQVPLGIKKMSLIGNFQVYNLFNNMRQLGIYKSYASGSGEESTFPIAYDVTRYGTTQPGTANEWKYYNNGRYAASSIGLRF